MSDIESVLLEKVNGKWGEVVAVSGEVSNKNLVLITDTTTTFIPYERG